MQSKVLPLLAAVLLPSLAFAQSRPHAHAPAHAAPAARTGAGPKSIGKFDDWQAATLGEGEQTVCYAFTRAASSQPKLPGRGDVVLTVAQRSTGRDAVALSAGFAYPANAEVQVRAEGAPLAFYTANRSAFARDGKAVVAAFGKGRQAVAKSPSPRNTVVSDTFSLRGFTPAYALISKACPAK